LRLIHLAVFVQG